MFAHSKYAAGASATSISSKNGGKVIPLPRRAQAAIAKTVGSSSKPRSRPTNAIKKSAPSESLEPQRGSRTAAEKKTRKALILFGSRKRIPEVYYMVNEG